MFANAKTPSLDLSCNFLDRVSLIITREINDELLLVMLFLGFRLLFRSLVFSGASRVFPSPKAGADIAVSDAGPSLSEVPWPSPSLLNLASSFGCSAMLVERAAVEG